MDRKLDIQIKSDPLSVTNNYNFVLDENCGGIDMFIGTVRKWNKGQEITHLEFEAYEPMAIKELNKIATAAFEKFSVQNISIHHRVGKVELKEEAVIIAVSSIHRKASFEACHYIIDELKKHVPIWKKEFLLDGSYWVNSRP